MTALWPRLIPANLAIVQPAADSGDLRRKIDCPHCHHRMDSHIYAGPGNVVFESCEPCPLNWLDHGELSRVVQARDTRNSEKLSGSASSRYADSAE